MSDQMLTGVLRMPLPDDPAELDIITWLQFRDRARQSADEIDRLLAENKRLREALTWQPIESAPKDGSMILACNIDPARKNPSVIYWEFGSNPFGIAPHWRDSTHHSVGYHEFTHWMPLPAPPEQNADRS